MPPDAPSRPLRIGLLTHSVNPRGGVVHTIELAHALTAAGHDVTVMAPATPGQMFFRPLHCAVDLAPLPRATAPQSLVASVRQRIDAYVDHLSGGHTDLRAFDVLHAHDGIGGNALATLQERGLIGGFVRTVHHLDPFTEPELTAWQLRAFRRAERVLCVSRLWCEILARDHGVTADEVSNGVDATRFSPAVQPGDGALLRSIGLDGFGPLVLAVGGVEPRKNTQRLLQAFARVRERLPQARLAIVGGASVLNHDAYTAEFHRMAAALGLADSPALRLTGPVGDDVVAALMRHAALLALPSLREGFGLVVLEALASGTPVLVSRREPFTGYLLPDDAAWADPLHVASIADGLLDGLLRPPTDAALAATAGRLTRRFSWRASAERHVAIYREVLAGRAAALPEPMSVC